MEKKDVLGTRAIAQVGIIVKDIDATSQAYADFFGMGEKVAAMERLGMPLAQKGEYTGGRYAYMETMKDLKVMLELLENDKK